MSNEKCRNRQVGHVKMLQFCSRQQKKKAKLFVFSKANFTLTRRKAVPLLGTQQKLGRSSNYAAGVRSSGRLRSVRTGRFGRHVNKNEFRGKMAAGQNRTLQALENSSKTGRRGVERVGRQFQMMQEALIKVRCRSK